MGASDSKLVFKKGIFRLSEDKVIPADDPYWASVRHASPTFIVYLIMLTPLSFGSFQSQRRIYSVSSPLQIFEELAIMPWKISKR
jgi:hypothetical protein